MTHDCESKIAALEAEIRSKDQLISSLYHYVIFAYLLPTYLHETRHILSRLSMMLTTLFREYPTESLTLRQEITGDFEHLRTLHEYFHHFIGSKKKTATLNECIEKTIEILLPSFSKSAVSLQKILSKKGETFKVPEVDIQQILIDILLNALESVQETNEKDRLVIIETMFDEKFLRIQISDNGPGFGTKFPKPIWLPRFPTKRDKIGLGLNIAEDVVKSLGGYISTSNYKGQLTQFTVVVPVEQASSEFQMAAFGDDSW